MREARGEIHGFLTDREIARAIIAKWWGTNPFDLRRIPQRELRLMAEIKTRVQKAEHDELEAVKRGAPTPGRGPASPQGDDW